VLLVLDLPLPDFLGFGKVKSSSRSLSEKSGIFRDDLALLFWDKDYFKGRFPFVLVYVLLSFFPLIPKSYLIFTCIWFEGVLVSIDSRLTFEGKSLREEDFPEDSLS
jgi:hypothetical protein